MSTVWSKELPKKAGFYWWRSGVGAKTTSIIRVDLCPVQGSDPQWRCIKFGSPTSVLVQARSGEWYGPIYPPNQE